MAEPFFGLTAFGMQLHFDAAGDVHGFAGAAWRGFMGRVLQRAVCPYSTPACTACPSVSMCTYANLFKPILEASLAPFWLHGWHRHASGWTVGIRWLGCQHDYAVGEWLGALAHGSHDFSIGGQPARLDRAVSASTGKPLWCRRKGWHGTPEPLLLARPYPASGACRVRSLTPLVSKHAGNPLFGALHTRVQRLLQQHGDGRLLPRPVTPWRGRVVAQQAQSLALSNRTLAGNLWTLELSELDPAAWALLSAGVHLHAGGQTSMGCGHYQIEEVDHAFTPPLSEGATNFLISKGQ